MNKPIYYQRILTILSKKPIWFILFFSLAIRLVYLSFDYPLWWDSHVYIGIGKYLFSGAQIGIWESFRPLIHPLLLGSFWKLGANPIVVGKILDLIFSLAAIAFLYLLAQRIFGKTCAIFSSLLFSLTPLFIMYTGLILTEPLALALGLCALLLLIPPEPSSSLHSRTVSSSHVQSSSSIKTSFFKTVTSFFHTFLSRLSLSQFSQFSQSSQSQSSPSRSLSLQKDPSLLKIAFAGLLLSLSFLARFPQGIWFVVALSYLFFRQESLVPKVKRIAVFAGSFCIPVLPYLWFNHLLYGNAFEPFVAGSQIVTTATWLYGSGVTYYFTQFFLSNAFYLFSFVYLYFFIKEKQFVDKRKTLVVLIPLLSLLYFLYVPRKEPRYLVTSLPFFAIMASCAFMSIYSYLKLSSKPLLKPRAFLLICLFLILIPIPMKLYFERAPVFQQEISQVIEDHNITGTIVSSDPSFVSFLDHPLVTLDGMEFAPIIYQQQQGKYELLFINDCDLICAAQDRLCQSRKHQLLIDIAAENREIFKKEINSCTYIIYLPS